VEPVDEQSEPEVLSAHGRKCREALGELYEFLDGELTVERKETIREHLDDCFDCLGAFDFEAELRVVISSCCRKDQVPDHLRRRIAEALGFTGA
jgi:mycothiol system anti-sigma-R factor